MAQKKYHWCGGRVWTDNSSVHVHRHISTARHERYRHFYLEAACKTLISSCPSCHADLYEAERAGDLRDLLGEPDIGKAIRAWQKTRRKQVRPGAQPPANPPHEARDDGDLPYPDAEKASEFNLDKSTKCAIIRMREFAPPAQQSTHKETPTVTATAPTAPAIQPAAASPAARKLLARLTGTSPAGQSVSVTMEQSTSAAATVFLNISTDGVDAPAEKFLGVQKARANARLLAIKKELRGATLERFDEPEPEPEPAKPIAPAKGSAAAPAKGKATAPATGKGKTATTTPVKGSGKPAPAAPTAPVRTRDQITVIKELGRYAALMIVGPNSRYEVVKDRGTPDQQTVWDVKATRAWQPQQRAAKEKVDELYAADPSAPVGAAPEPEPVAAPAPPAEPVAAPEPEPEPVTAAEPEPVAAPEPEPEPVTAAEPAAPKKGSGRKATPKKVVVEPDDDGPAL